MNMLKAIIIHGMSDKKSHYVSAADSQSNRHWIPWLQQQLIANDILAQTPEMPIPYEPNYERWLSVFKQFEVDEDTTLVGHSCGGGFLVRWLTENNVKVRKVILVAPWIDPAHTVEMFTDFCVGNDLVTKTVKGIIVFNSDNDDASIHESVKIIRGANKEIKYREFHNYGHFVLKHMETREFPELLEEAII